MDSDYRELRNRVRAADPARTIAALPETWLDHRMEQIMTDSTPTPISTAADTAPSRRRAWVPLIGVAAALTIGAAIAVPLTLSGTPTTEQLAAPEGGGLSSGSCMPVTAEGLQAQEQAFAAKVIVVDGGTVTLEVTERFKGEVADRVEVPQNEAIDSDFSSVVFELGESYLVAAGDATIRGCGLSGDDSPELRAIYDDAFGE